MSKNSDYLILIPARDWYRDGRYMGRAPEMLIACSKYERDTALADQALNARDVSDDAGAWSEYDREHSECY